MMRDHFEKQKPLENGQGGTTTVGLPVTEKKRREGVSGGVGVRWKKWVQNIGITRPQPWDGFSAHCEKLFQPRGVEKTVICFDSEKSQQKRASPTTFGLVREMIPEGGLGGCFGNGGLTWGTIFTFSIMTEL